MNGGHPNPFAARRQISYLSTFDKKFQGFRREMERLERAAASGRKFGSRWPTEGLERITRSLVGAGAVYGLNEITDWAREFLSRLESIRSTEVPPSEDDFAWLAHRITVLDDLRQRGLAAARGEPAPTPRAAATERAETGFAEAVADPEGSEPKTEIEAPVDADRGSLPKPEHARAPEPAPADREPERLPAPVRPPDPEAPLRATALVIADSKAMRGQVGFALSNAGFEVKKASSPQEALRIATEESPELIVVDADDPPPGGSALVDDLARDPLTDYIPLIRLASLKGTPPAKTVPKPIDVERLVAEARRLAAPGAVPYRVSLGMRDPDLGELVDFVAGEIRAGVLDSATGTHASERFRVLGEGQLMASVWALVAKLRRTAARGSGGRIRFIPASSGQTEMMALAEAEEVLDPAGHTDLDEEQIAALNDLQAVVADDDPKIRVVFDRVLSSAGMKVRTATDGMEALDGIRESPPDLVVTDILMPRMDGWELLRRLRTDYALRHVPVIVLSWKEDFLEQMRGLKTGADDFMLKEVDVNQILGRVARAMKPRLVLQRQLVSEGDVTGRIERVGVITVIDEALRLRSNCRLTFRESWNYFEANVVMGELAAVTRTGSDGSFSSGPPALERLLGVSAGRFSVLAPTDTPRRQFREGTRKAIKDACDRLNGLVGRVIDGALLGISKVELDEEVLGLYSHVMPPKLEAPLERLREGESPRETVLSGTASPDTVETLLLDLIRVGAIRAIGTSPEGGDLPADRGAQGRPSIGEPVPAPAAGAGPTGTARDDRPDTMPISLDDLTEVSSPGSALPPARRSPTPPPPPPRATRMGISTRRGVSRAWRVLAAIAIAALVVSAYLNLELLHGREAGDAAGVEIETPPPKNAAREPALEAVDRPDTAAPEEAPEAPETAVKSKPPAVEEENDEEAAKERREKRRESRRRERREKTEGKTGKDGDGPGAAPAAAPAGTGTLQVLAPEGAADEIRVSVDGKLRGHAPLEMDLEPGLHEIVYSLDGKRKMRMVSIKSGQTKSVTAKVPQ